MNADKRRRRGICNSRLHHLSDPLLFLSLMLPASSFALILSQNPHPSVSEAPAAVASTVFTSPIIPSTFSTTTLPSTAVATLVLLPQSVEGSSVASRVTKDNAPELHPAPTSSSTSAASDDSTVDRKSHLLNYYFVFLALIGVIACVTAYMVHKRRRRRKARLRNSGQNALAQDLDGWVNTRRWIYGSWRGVGGGGGVARREEGLNEDGEAPPPYKLRADATSDDAGGQPARMPSDRSRDPATGLAIPLRTLSRGRHSTMKPPDYQETVDTVSVGETTRPNTTESPPGTSTRDLLHPLDRPSS
jgi:hypothetical protein